MSHWKTVLVTGACVFLALACSSSVSAQVPRYAPPGGSPLPAALDYFRQDVGLLDPYNTFVAPRRQLTNQLQAITARQQADFRAAEAQISALRGASAAPTGVGAGYMNYSHYYSISPVGRSRPGR
ncbi:MAG TPA: hypothetical protein VFV87_19145 [Pirellulaceae bacterium]|nr:hypothetical protein [Pirellulaceae bacterium]